MFDEDVAAACNAVDLDTLPGLPESLRSMVMEGRRGQANPALRDSWARDLEAYAFDKEGITAKITPKLNWLRVVFFKASDLKEHVNPSDAMYDIAAALETCSVRHMIGSRKYGDF